MKTTTAVSVEDYFKALEASEIKLEYHEGEIVAKAGAQPPHVHVQSNFLIELGHCLKAKGCSIMTSDLLVKAGTCNNYYYPDLVIVCQKEKYTPNSFGLLALENPEIIIEILSPSTELFDRTRKFDCYKTISGFREYVLVDSTKKQIEIITKLSEAEWLSHTYFEKDKSIRVNGCEVLISDIYDKVEFEGSI
jgi:Uma2 family endonuclease